MYSVHYDANALPPLRELPERTADSQVLLVRPTYFDVLYEINPHMKGNIGKVNKQLAMLQWETIQETYTRLGYPVNVIEGIEGLPDMVFCANQSFPFVDADAKRSVIISKMASPYRANEVGHIAAWYEQQNYHVIRQVHPPVEFEGMGDAIWHPNRKLLYIGYGYRTSKKALQRAANCLCCDVIGLELKQPHFYHLDTALSTIDEHTAIYVPEAFSDQGVAVLRRQFTRLIPVPLQEAKFGFVTNGHSPDGKHFIVHRGNHHTKKALENLGISVIELDTSEFMKSGGSVFCMKMMLP